MELTILSFLILIFSIAFANSAWPLLAGVLTFLLLSLIKKIKPAVIFSFLKAPIILLLMMIPFILLTPGITFQERIDLLRRMSIRSLTIFGLLALLLKGSDKGEIHQAIKNFPIPGKFLLIVFSTWRYINLYISDLGKLMTAARIRGFSLTKGIRHLTVSADILLTLLIRSYEQSERVQAAMISRGFTGELPATTFTETKPVKENYILSATAIFGAIVIILLEILC